MATTASDIVETIRAAAVTTTSYVASSSFKLMQSQSKFALEFSVTKGSADSIEWKFEGSNDGGTTWFTEFAEAYSAGTTTAKPNVHTVAASDLGTTDTFFVTYTRGPYFLLRLKVKSTTQVATLVAIVVRKMSGTPT